MDEGPAEVVDLGLVEDLDIAGATVAAMTPEEASVIQNIDAVLAKVWDKLPGYPHYLRATPSSPVQDEISAEASNAAAAPVSDATLAAQMTAVWNEVVAGTPLRQARTPRDPAIIAALMQAINQDTFGNRNIGAWRRFCLFCSQDPHCRGERNGTEYPNWTADLRHVIQPHVTQRLLDDCVAHKQREATSRALDAAIEQAYPGRVLPEYYVKGAGTLFRQERMRTPEGRAELASYAGVGVWDAPVSLDEPATPRYPPGNGGNEGVWDRGPPHDPSEVPF